MVSDDSIRILLADDSVLVRRQLKKLLEAKVPGAVVDEAEDGHQAVEKVKSTQPDIAILDVAMPVLNGLLAAERISEIAPDLPIVVHTMYATPQIEDEVKRRGAKAVIPKTDTQGLISFIERLSAQEIGMRPEWL